MSTAILHVEGMTCKHCKMSVENALKTLDGVQNATVDLDSKTVSIDYDPAVVDEESLKKIIGEAGYEVK